MVPDRRKRPARRAGTGVASLLGDKHVLALSHQATYLVGRCENHRFTPQRDRLDSGWIYAPQFVLDGKGRRIMWGWVPGWRQDPPRPREDVIRAGWSALLTVPRVVTLGPDDRLRFEPVKELEMLRDQHACLDDVTLLPNTTLTLDRPRGSHLEIDARLRASEANQYGVILLDGQQRIEAEYNAVSGSLPLGRQSGPLKLEQGVPLRLRIFVDGLVVEVFANRRLCLTEMIYPAQPKILQVGLFANGGRATADRVDVWHLTGIRSGNAFAGQDGKGYLKTPDGAIHVVLLRS